MAESYEWGDLIQRQIARLKSVLIHRLIADHHPLVIISISSSTRRRRRRRSYAVHIENKRSSSSTPSGIGMAIKAEREGSNKLMNQPLSGVTIRRRVVSGQKMGEKALSGGEVRLRNEICATD
jgi:hypothetical protein